MLNFVKQRSNVFKIFVFVMFAIIIARLFEIQILDHDEYVVQAQEIQMMQNVIVAKRGQIYALDGDEPVPLVMNEKVWSIILDPQISRSDRENIEKTIGDLAKDYMVAKWEDVFKSTILRYYVVAKNVPYRVAEKIKNEELPGVYFQSNSKRVYPEGQLASGLLGFVNSDGIGQYGIEGGMNDRLAGKNGVLKTIKDVNNTPLTIGDDNVRIPAQDGENIVLTVDRNIQFNVEKILAEKMKEYGAGHGAAVVMDPNNGKVLAMVGLPNYDPSKYADVEDASVFITPATLEPYESASICKTFAFSTGIDMGKITPETTYYNHGTTEVDGFPIDNADTKQQLGTISLQTALTYSLNTGSTQVLRLLGDSETEITQTGKDRLFDYYFNKFNFGHYTGIEIAESPGYIVSSTSIDGTNARYANMTFGQGFTASLLQIAAAYSSVLNGGEYYNPTLVAGTIDENGKFIRKDTAAPDHKTISNESSKIMRGMLHTARNFYRQSREIEENQGVYTGGKTGTGQVAGDGAYLDDETTASYVGFVSKDESSIPEYVVAVKIWEKGKEFGGEQAMKIFNPISEYITDYLRV